MILKIYKSQLPDQKRIADTFRFWNKTILYSQWYPRFSVSLFLSLSFHFYTTTKQTEKNNKRKISLIIDHQCPKQTKRTNSSKTMTTWIGAVSSAVESFLSSSWPPSVSLQHSFTFILELDCRTLIIVVVANIISIMLNRRLLHHHRQY